MIEIHELRKKFGAICALDGLSASLAGGTVVGLVGPNGAGKSTLMKCLLGLVTPDAGRMVVNGMVLNGSAAYKAVIGYMPQNARYPENLRVEEMIHLVQKVRRDAVEPDLELLDSLNLRPILERPMRELSGGTRQRVSAALAFLQRPKVVILDEPTASLDPHSSAVVKDKIRASRSEGATTLISSHNMADVEELADSVIFMLEGRIVAQGAPEEIMTAAGETKLERAIAKLTIQRRT